MQNRGKSALTAVSVWEQKKRRITYCYIILAGIMGIKWRLLYRMTGNLWAGLSDNLFNNTVATNMLHVVSSTGANELQIVRIMAAQVISFAYVLAIYICRNSCVQIEEIEEK